MLSTTCFVEIKRHDTDLVVESSYRAGVWQPAKGLSGAVAQIQGPVSAALEQWRARETITTADGEPTGEILFTTEPRSFVIRGSLSEFQAGHGINERKFRSFELYRRHLIRPEIVTFDELYARARFIVDTEHNNDIGKLAWRFEGTDAVRSVTRTSRAQAGSSGPLPF
jgi:Domain of unknown function (DUF4263)